jgi:serine/threonine protein kinase
MSWRVKVLINFSKVSSFNNYRRFALKEIDALGIDTKEAFTIAKEATMLASLNHNNILKFHDSFLDNDFFYIVTQYCSVS